MVDSSVPKRYGRLSSEIETSASGIGLPRGMIIFSDVDAISSYNTIRKNFVSGYEIGYTDGAPKTGFLNGISTLFTQNVGTGNNVNNQFFDPSTVEVNNIFTAVIPAPSGGPALHQLDATREFLSLKEDDE